MNRKKTLMLLLGIFFCLVLAGCGDSKDSNVTSVSTMHGSFSIDVNSFPELAGDADYVIVGKVLDELSVDYRWPVMIENEDGSTCEETTPYTNYSVQITENLKGELSMAEPIVVTKMGGISEDGNSYVIYENDILPTVGNSYVFFIYAQSKDGSNLASGPNSTIPLDNEDESAVATRAITEEINKSDVVNEMKEAVANQIVTDRKRAISNDDVATK